MSTSYTTLLGFALPTSGELDGSWGDVVNASITELVEDSIAGSVTASVASADWTLSTTGSGAVNQARAAILTPTGTSASARSIFAPNLSKAYIVHNQSNVAVTVKGSTGPTTGATVVAGTSALVAWSGSDYVLVAQNLENATGTLPVVQGGTGQTSYTNGQLLIGNSSGNTLTKATLTAGSGVQITNSAGGITIASDRVSSVSGTGTVNGISLSGTVTSTGNLTLSGALTNVSLSTQVTGTLPIVNGGTGQTTLAAASIVTYTGTETLTNKTLTDPAIIGTILEDVFTISDGAAFEIDPSNGSIQLITLGANRTPKATNFVAGEAITLMVDDGTAYAITWTDSTFGTGGVIWETDAGVAPTLSTTGYTTIVLWKVSTQVYGARVGNA